MEVSAKHEKEIRELPPEWKVKKLGDLASFRTGPFGSALHKSDYVNDGVPLVNPMHIVDGRIVSTTDMTVNDKTALRLSKYALQKGDIVIGRRGEMGRCAVIDKEEAGWLCGTGSLIIRPNSQALAGFLQRILASPRMVAAIENASVGSTMVNLNQGILARLDVQTPPLPEQRAIAEALSDVDALIERLDALIAKKRAVKTATMQRLLTGQQRLPGFEGAWETRRLGEVADMSSGGTPLSSVSAYYGGSIPWASVSDLSDGGKYLFETERHLTEAGLQNSAAKLFPPRSILYAMYASIGEVSIASMETSSSQAILGIRTRAQLDTEFLYYLLAHRQEEIQKMGQQGTQANLNAGMVKNFRIPLPSDKEQDAIVNILSDMDAEIEALGARRDKTQALKQGMMQVLLTGRTRLL